MAQDRKINRKSEDRGRPTPGETSAASGGDVRPAAGSSERIARRLARAGIASRRESEGMIAEGRVTVNGKVLTSPAINVTAADTILVDGEPIPDRERTRLFLFHKPAGTMTTNRDPEGRRTIFDVLPKDLPRLVTIGRLDFSTEGLLLLTNDGGLARVLELPSTGWLRRYRARVHGEVDPDALDRLKEGISVDGILYGSIDAALDRTQGSNAWLTLALREGKNREVRNVLGALGLQVNRLIRVSYGPFQLGDLPEGELLEVRGRLLRDQLGPRLIREAGADFEADIRQPFSSKPATESQGGESAGTAKPREKRKAPVSREQALERLDTRPARPRGKPAGAGMKADAGKGKERSPRAAEETTRSRAANVWRAPGARPLGPAALKKKQEEPSGRPKGGKRTGGPRKGGKNADRRR